MFEELAELIPARVGLELGVVECGIASRSGRRLIVELVADDVQPGDANIAATREVECSEVKRQAQQVVAQRASDEFVDLVADLVGSAEDDLAGSVATVREVLQGVCERFDQADLIENRRANDGRSVRDVCSRSVTGDGRVGLLACQSVGKRLVHFGRAVERIARGALVDDIAIDVLVQHRVTEAVDDVGEFRGDCRVQRDVVVAEQVDRRGDLASELFEHEVLVLCFGAELGCLEEAGAVPFGRLNAVSEVCAGDDPLCCK